MTFSHSFIFHFLEVYLSFVEYNIPLLAHSVNAKSSTS
nr:MAG TPA: hypothetical protein [Caudoviricetes sp.]